MPDQTTRIRDFAKGLFDAAPDEKAKASLAGQIAETLLTNKVLLPDAEQYATTYLDALKEADYIAEQKAQASRRAGRGGRGGRGNGEPPSDEDLAERFHEALAIGNRRWAAWSSNSARSTKPRSCSTSRMPPTPAAAGPGGAG